MLTLPKTEMIRLPFGAKGIFSGAFAVSFSEGTLIWLFLFCLDRFWATKKIGWHGIRSVGPTFAIDLPSWGSFDKIRNGKLHHNIFSSSWMAHDSANTHKSCFEQLLLTTMFTNIFPYPSFLSRIAPFTLELSPCPTSQALKFGNWSKFQLTSHRGLITVDGSSGTLHWWLVLDLAWVTMIYKRLWHIPGYGFSQKRATHSSISLRVWHIYVIRPNAQFGIPLTQGKMLSIQLISWRRR